MKTDSQLYQYAAKMREKPTASELLALSIITSKQGVPGWRLEHQFVFGHFILDFVLPERMLVIELDGSSHKGSEDYDFKRDLFCKRCGLRVLRIENHRTETLPQLLKSYPPYENWGDLWAKAVGAAMDARETKSVPTLMKDRGTVVKPENVKKKRREAYAAAGKHKPKAKSTSTKTIKRGPKLSEASKKRLAEMETRSPVLARRREQGAQLTPYVNPEPVQAKPKKAKYDVFSAVKKAQGKLGR